VHSPSVEEALLDFDCADTPAGRLPDCEKPRGMWPRTEVWDYALEQNPDEDLEVIQWFAAFMWMDQMLGALFDALTRFGVYDDTFVVLTNDHGMSGKGLLYQQGTRIMNFVRYPPRFGKDGPMVLPPDFVVSNVDMAATVFDLVGVTPPTEYVTDGKSFLTDVTNAINHPGEFAQTLQTSRVYKFIDMYQSHSIVMGHLQYIWRATDEIDEMEFGEQQPIDIYPNVYDMEQLYDLDADPSQQNNIFNDEQLMMDYASDIAEMQSLMREYVQDICQMDDVPCLMPDLAQSRQSAPTEPRCCYATDLANKNAMKCYDIGDDEVECELKSSRWSCAYGQGSDVCAVPTPKPLEPGCCFGSNGKCTTDDEALCVKFSARAGCEWRSGEDADCTPAPPEPGCCFGSNSKCSTDDEAQCLKGARAGCEWRSGAEANCEATPAEPGCCVGSDSKCDTDDEDRCKRLSARAGCEWRTGDDANCALESNEQGVLSVLDTTTNAVQSNGIVDVAVVMVAGLVLSAVIIRLVCAGKVHGKKTAVPWYGSAI